MTGYAAMMGPDFWMTLDGDNAVEQLFKNLAVTVGIGGNRCCATIGPESDEGIEPRLEVFIDEGNVFMRADGRIAIEPDRAIPGFQATHHVDSKTPLNHSRTMETRSGTEDVPIHHMRVSPNRAAETVKRFIATGQRPDCVEWIRPGDLTVRPAARCETGSQWVVPLNRLFQRPWSQALDFPGL